MGALEVVGNFILFFGFYFLSQLSFKKSTILIVGNEHEAQDLFYVF